MAGTAARPAKPRAKAPARKAGLPSNPTPAQRKAAAAMALTPKQQAKAWKTTSAASPRLLEAHAQLDALVRARFPDAEPAFDYNMRGWKMARRKRITEWKGTMDPNWIRLYVAERKQGITLHVWNPFDHKGLEKHEAALKVAGFKVMVGCLQYNRTGPVPLEALQPLLKEMAKARDSEG